MNFLLQNPVFSPLRVAAWRVLTRILASRNLGSPEEVQAVLAGAMLISNDLVDAEGVGRAFREFFANKPEVLIELTGTQVAFIRAGCE